MVNTRGLTSDPWSAEEHHDYLPLIGQYLTLLASDWPAMSWGPGPVWWSASVIPSPGPHHDTSTRPSHHIPLNIHQMNTGARKIEWSYSISPNVVIPLIRSGVISGSAALTATVIDRLGYEVSRLGHWYTDSSKLKNINYLNMCMPKYAASH